MQVIRKQYSSLELLDFGDTRLSSIYIRSGAHHNSTLEGHMQRVNCTIALQIRVFRELLEKKNALKCTKNVLGSVQ